MSVSMVVQWDQFTPEQPCRTPVTVVWLASSVREILCGTWDAAGPVVFHEPDWIDPNPLLDNYVCAQR